MIASVIIWFIICIYVDYRIYKTNQSFFKKQKGFIVKHPLLYEQDFLDRYISGVIFFLHPFILFTAILHFGLSILNSNRSIFNGEKL